MKFNPMGDRIVIEFKDDDEKSAGGIILTENAQTSRPATPRLHSTMGTPIVKRIPD